MPVPYTFGTATTSIPLSNLDANFNTPVTIGNTTVGLGNTVTTIGNLTLTNATISTGNVTVTTGIFGAGSNTAPSITTTGDTNTGIFFPAADTIAFTEGGTEAMRLTSAGDVAIGITSASHRLHVYDSTNATVMYANSGSTGVYLRLGNSVNQGGYLGYEGTGGTNMTFYTSATEKMRITSTGAVGIGTSSPSSLLNVSGTGASGLLRINRTDGAGFIDINSSNGVAGASIGSTGTQGLQFYTNYSTSPLLAMSIDSSGNVGIGTSSPSTRLNVVGSANVATFDGSSATSISLTGSSRSDLFLIDSGSATDQKRLTIRGDGGNFIFGVENDAVTAFTERMRIDSSGNLLVGATTTNNKFRVYLNSTSEGNASTANFTQDGTGDAAISFLIGVTTEWLVGVDNSDSDTFKINNITGGGNFTNTGLNITTGGNVAISGSLSKGSGSFKINHPLPAKTDTHHLVHSFIEGPQADLIYRGRVTLVDGKATVNIDESATMTEGTFDVLCRDVQCFTTNESDWTPVRGSVTGNILTIESQDATAKSEISWMVIGERKDKHMMYTDWTDENGKVIVEPLKETTN
jgi:hypothetical protein